MAEHTFHLSPESADGLTRLCGELNHNIHLLASCLDTRIKHRGFSFHLESSSDQNLLDTETILRRLYVLASRHRTINAALIHLELKDLPSVITQEKTTAQDDLLIHTPRKNIKPRGTRQQQYVTALRKNTITFGIGPAGTGKTYLAVACAVEALQNETVQRLILVRPAVEAGERLGFLPGDLSQKIDPYLRPLYDALYDTLGHETVAKLIEKRVIEIVPLAYMRGRTLNDAFIILDEGQNTTIEQMKMLLTRIGIGSSAVITGDMTQVDLPKGVKSGLRHAAAILNDIDDIQFSYFLPRDIVRHRLVQNIVTAYENASQPSPYDS